MKIANWSIGVAILFIPLTLALSSCNPSASTAKQHVKEITPYKVDWGSCAVDVIPVASGVQYIVKFPDTLRKLQFVNAYESPKDLYLAFKSFPYLHTECWPEPAGSFTPGYDSPEDAATGYLQAVESGNTSQACQYVALSTASCINGITSGGHVSIVNGNAIVVGGITSGDRALVEITGNLCFSNGHCDGNGSPVTGMPIGKETFAQAWANVLRDGSFSPGLYKKINGQWYFTPFG